jgi:predicted  nucleic acid-binding Zn-ribbon protein
MAKQKSDQEQTELSEREQALQKREEALEYDLKKLNIFRKNLSGGGEFQ